MHPAFAGRFAIVQEITRADSSGAGVWVVRDLQRGTPWLLKCSRHVTRADVLTHLRRLQPSPGLLLPSEQGALGATLAYELTALPSEDVRDLTQSATPGEWLETGRTTVAQLSSALELLHSSREGAWVLHGDVKPGNVVSYRERDGQLRFGLIDFDAAVLLGTPGNPPVRLTRLTPAYAAPEVLGGGQLTEKADFWSLGMLVLERLLGRHPLDGLSVQLQRGAVAGAWRPDISGVDSAEWRALVGGLLQREAALRWGRSDIARWLNGEPGMISLGLSLVGESASPSPFFVLGQPVYSAESLARHLLREWCLVTRQSVNSPTQSNAREVDAEPLLTWLRDDLLRPDVAGLLERLIDDAQLSPGIRLLHFARELWPAMPATWQGRALDAPELDGAAASALNGSAADLAWLLSVRDSGVLTLLEQRGYEGVSSLSRNWLASRERYAEAWNALLQRGAPEEARPASDQELLLATRMAFSEDYRRALRGSAARLLDPVDWLSRQPWFLHFGSDPAQMPIEQIAVLHQLDRPSRQEVISLDNLAALRSLPPHQARSCLVISRGEQRRLRKMLVTPGAATLDLRPGSVFVPRPRPAILMDALRAFNAWAQRQYSWFRRARTDAATAQPGGPRPAAADAGNAPADTGVPLMLQVRLTELSLPGVANALGGMPLYATRISWQAPAGSELTLRIRRRGWPRADRLRLRQLPEQAQIGLLLSQTCRIDLVCRTGPMSWQRTRPIDLILPAALDAIESERQWVGVGRLTLARARFAPAQAVPPMQVAPASAMSEPDRTLILAGSGFVPAESRGMEQADTQLRASAREFQGIEAQLANMSGLFCPRPFADSPWVRLRQRLQRRLPETGSVT